MAGRFAIELGEQDAEVATRIQQDFARQSGALRECVEGAQRAGDLDPAASADDIAGLLLAITRGMEVVARAGADLAALQATASQAYASLPLTPRARRRAARDAIRD